MNNMIATNEERIEWLLFDLINSEREFFRNKLIDAVKYYKQQTWNNQEKFEFLYLPYIRRIWNNLQKKNDDCNEDYLYRYLRNNEFRDSLISEFNIIDIMNYLNKLINGLDSFYLFDSIDSEAEFLRLATYDYLINKINNKLKKEIK